MVAYPCDLYHCHVLLVFVSGQLIYYHYSWLYKIITTATERQNIKKFYDKSCRSVAVVITLYSYE